MTLNELKEAIAELEASGVSGDTPMVAYEHDNVGRVGSFHVSFEAVHVCDKDKLRDSNDDSNAVMVWGVEN